MADPFPYPSLDFPGRTMLLLSEAAGRLGVSVRHLQREAEEGVLVLVDVRGANARQPAWRLPIECYRDYVSARLSGPERSAALQALPEATRASLIRELVAGLPTPTRMPLLKELRAMS